MMDRTFRSLSLEVHGTGKYRTVSSVVDAASCLLEYWPGQTGEAFVAALIACQAAMDGNGSAEAVREALIAAAREADVFIMRE